MTTDSETLLMRLSSLLKRRESDKAIKQFCKDNYAQCTGVTLRVHNKYPSLERDINLTSDVLVLIEKQLDTQIAKYNEELSEYEIIKPLKNPYAE